MITKETFKSLLEELSFTSINDIYVKHFSSFDCELQVDFANKCLIYPEKKGLTVNDKTTCNFSSAENFVVFECVYRLLEQGYNPKHIELEKKWQLGHSQKSGKADICVKDNDDNLLLIIECKTAGDEYKKAINILENDGRNQLFSYLQQASSTQFLALYASDFVDNSITPNYYLINVTDNTELLENNSTLKSYKEATTTEEKWQVWCDTYDKEYATIGLFENNQPYQIGKQVYSVDDLKNIINKDIQGKYHEFATILRQHNVSGRENAFDKLVNLFLCKVTDETENSAALSFYWKGKAYDDPFNFQDRLQHLYQTGMDKFLDDKITYIANQQIDEAFGIFKDKPNVAKDTIKEYVKQLKFFSNNDFAFIDVHNEKLFYQNFEVLLKITKMIQDIRLTGSEENQFLGDMFESFLDQGVKQSEGQFFTPMPIVKFIINSLPHKEQPRVLDYACGAGHFLNEYYNSNQDSIIIGVEKEYRLSKVAKVSSFMYGSDMDIVYNDALIKNAKIPENSFDVLIANPPYSVKGFLTTLSQDDRNEYELIDLVDGKSLHKTNAIECFFIERAKQLLKKDAVVGIIVPSSILNKDTPNLYTKTRELILQHFTIVAIAEFGSGTFGKTGTNTVTLFLRRRDPAQKLDIHYKNMVEAWFKGDFDSNNSFKDDTFLADYCRYIEVEQADYTALLQGTLTDGLLKQELFSEYEKAFNKKYKAPKTKEFKALSADKKQAIKQQALITFVRDKEQDKLYFFCLAKSQDNDVVIVKAPSDNKNNKKFLGYEWSSRKGNEGIQYLSQTNVEIDEADDLEAEDKRILENQQGLKFINTPLYNPQNSDDTSKINKIIKDNFNGLQTPIHDDIAKFVNRASLFDMLDFNRVDFGKTLSLTPKKKIEIESKYPLEKLGDVVNVLIGGTPSRKNNSYFNGENLWVSISEMNGNIIVNTKEKITNEAVEKSNVKLIPEGTTLLSFKLSIGKTAIAGKDLYTNEAIAGLVPKTNTILNSYLFCLFSAKFIDLEKDGFNSFGKSLNSNFLKEELKIPLPPIDVQKQIVAEIEVLEKEEKKCIDDVEGLQKNVYDFLYNEYKARPLKYFLDEINPKKADIIRNLDLKTEVSFLSMEDVGNDGVIHQLQTRTLEKTRTGYTFFQNQDVLFAKITPCMENGKGAFVEGLQNNIGFGSTEFLVLRANKDLIEPKILFYISQFKAFREEAQKHMTGSSGHRRVPKAFVENYEVSLPPLPEQQKIVAEIEKIEAKISELTQQIEQIAAKKEAVLKKYL